MTAPVFPVAVLFVLTARPARIYAESAQLATCDTELFVACASETQGAICPPQGTVERFCQPSACDADDGGAGKPLQALACQVPPTCGLPGAVAACTGKASADTCTQGGAAGTCQVLGCAFADGGPRREIGCIVTPAIVADAATAPTTSPTPGKTVTEDAPPGGTGGGDDGCATAGGLGARHATTGLAALAGVALAVVGFRRRLRRR